MVHGEGGQLCNRAADAPRGSRSWTGTARGGIPMAVGDSQAGRQTATGRTSGPHPPGLHLTLVLYVPGGWWFSTSNRAHHPHPTPPDPPAKEVWENKQRVVVPERGFTQLGRRRPTRRRRSSFRWQRPSPGPRGTQGSRGQRTPPCRSRAERSRGLPAHNASRTHSCHMGRRRPTRRRRSSFRWQSPSPGPRGTQGSRGKRAPPCRSPRRHRSLILTCIKTKAYQLTVWYGLCCCVVMMCLCVWVRATALGGTLHAGRPISTKVWENETTHLPSDAPRRTIPARRRRACRALPTGWA